MSREVKIKEDVALELELKMKEAKTELEKSQKALQKLKASSNEPSLRKPKPCIKIKQIFSQK